MGAISFENYKKKYNEGITFVPKNNSIQKNKKNQQSAWLSKGAFEDGYQFGDVTKTVLSTAGDVGVNLAKGVFHAGESLGDFASHGVAGVADFLGAKDYAKTVREGAAFDLTNHIFKGADKIVDKNSVLGEKTDSVIDSIGNMYGQAAVSKQFLSGIGNKGNVPISIGNHTLNMPITSLISGAASGMNEATEENASNWQIWAKGITGGLSEGISEGLFGFFGMGGSDLDDIVIKGATKNIENAMVKTLTTAGIKALGEGTEEVASYLLEYTSEHILDYAKNTLNLSGVDLADAFSSEELWENFMAGTLAAGLSAGGSAILNRNGNINSDVLSGVDQFKSNITRQANKIASDIEKSNNTKLNYTNRLLLENIMYNQSLSGNTTYDSKAIVDEFLRIKSEKIDNLKNSAYRYFEQNAETNAMLNTVSRFIYDKNYNVTFDTSITNENGIPVNAMIQGNNIILNPNSNEAIEFLLMHEVTHSIENKEMVNLVMNYAKKNPGFNSALESLKRTYGTNNVSSEVLADISAQYFGDQDFINNLSNEEPGLFRKLSNSIATLSNKLTGNTNENLFIKELKEKWQDAYTSQKNNISEPKYMIAGLKGLENYDNTNNTNGRKKYQEALDLKSKGLDNERIRQQTGFYQDKNGDWKFEIDDSSLTINHEIIHKNGEYKLGEIISHDYLFNLYPELNDYKVKFEDLNNISGSFVFKNKTIKINNSFFDNVDYKSIKGTLLHEIQHAIQHIEGFETGKSSKLSKKAYYNSLGEIEASDTKSRYMNNLSQEERLTTAPESSKSNPKHPQYDNYLNNRKTVDKVKDVIYPYIEGKIKNDKTNQESLPQNRRQNSNMVVGGRLLNENSQETLPQDKKQNNRLVDGRGLLNNDSSFSMTEDEIDTSYRMDHQPSKMGAGYDLTSESAIDETIYTNPEWYANMQEQSYRESFNVLTKIRNNPDAEVIIYRATPSNTINVGDWITLSKTYAQEHLERTLDGQGNIVEKKVKAKDIQWAGDDINEFGYFPDGNEKYSISNDDMWKKYLKENYTESSGKKTYTKDIRRQIEDSNMTSNIELENNDYDEYPRYSETSQNNNVETSIKSNNSNKLLDPIEISNLTKEDANTTPKLPDTNRNNLSDGDSNFYNNIKNKTNMLNEEQKKIILTNEEVSYYDKITNEETLEEAFKRMGTKYSTESWFGKDSNNADAIDVAQGWILLKQYADNNDADGMVAVAKKMRDIGTKAGQTVQAFNLMERMTPEGMVKYAQSELEEAYNKMIKNKSKSWIDKHRADFDLKPSEVQFIMDNMKEVSTMEDGYDKRVKLAEIQKIMTDKLPTEKGAGIKSWMRISMLFNPKTQVRNVAGNAIIAPVNYFGDLFSSYADKLISKKTNIRTTGNMNVKAILKGMKDGAYQATNDYKKGINTKDMEGNRFEIGEGKSFNDKTIIGKSLNNVEGLLNYVMDAGDRVFSQASFENSLQNQMILNNTTEITPEMIDIARTESLQRTWNDNNGYTQFVLNIRKGMNKLNIKGYGLGDVLIPFAKTPANLTKAIVDYSPLGLVQTINDGIKLKRSLSNGQYTPQMQHKFVQDLGKATAGTMLYIAGFALAKAGITSGESDDDKDVANFLKNTLGINNYSIKIGDKTFTYDWAQPLAAPLSITANIVKNQKANASLLENITSSLDTAGNILLEQSFLDSLNTVFSNNEGIVTGIEEAILELPSRSVPTFVKQIADLVDGTQRTSFEKDKPLESSINKVKVKIPGLSKSLAPTVDTMGREIQKYGGKNNIFNVFLNPANVNIENISESAKEIYDVYKATGDKTIMPRVADYTYTNAEGQKIPMTSQQRSTYQKKSGKLIEDNIQELMKNNEYQNMSAVEKADIISNIVNFSYNIGKNETFETPISDSYRKAYNYSKIGNISDFYLIKSQEFTSDVDENGETISGSKKAKVVNYINSMNLSIADKAILIKMNGYSLKEYDNLVINYINEKKISMDDKISILDQLGYTIKDGKVYN